MNNSKLSRLCSSLFINRFLLNRNDIKKEKYLSYIAFKKVNFIENLLNCRGILYYYNYCFCTANCTKIYLMDANSKCPLKIFDNYLDHLNDNLYVYKECLN